MIYSKIYEPVLYVAPKQRARSKEIKKDAPTGNLGMVIAARVVLPAISKSICPGSLPKSSDKDIGAKHLKIQIESNI
jgi:hypothetical protein